MRRRIVLTVALAGAFLMSGSRAFTGPQDNDSGRPAYLNPDLPVGRRVDDLVSRMTMEEKAGQLVNTAAAKQADVVVAVVGITSQLEGEQGSSRIPLPEGFSGGDRTSISLPKDEENLLQAVKAAGKPLVVVLMNGSALAVNWANENANAILESWYPGEEGGAAVAETLAGINNPAGRLPVTFYKSTDDLPAFEDYSMKRRTYRYFDGKPLFPFGYGLSYSKFAYRSRRSPAEGPMFADHPS